MALLGQVWRNHKHRTPLPMLTPFFTRLRRCGFPLDPDLRAEWAVARSLEDCTEAKQLEKWWGVGGLSAITRAMFSNSASVSEPPSLDPELFWNGIPHEMRKGGHWRHQLVLLRFAGAVFSLSLFACRRLFTRHAGHPR